MTIPENVSYRIHTSSAKEDLEKERDKVTAVVKEVKEELNKVQRGPRKSKKVK